MDEMNFVHGSYKDNPKYKGWITGSFYPSDTTNHDEDIEIKIDYFDESESFKPHYHKIRKTWTIVLKGIMHMVIDSKQIDIKEGEYIIYNPGVVEELLSTEPGTIAVSIHKPSTEVDKVEVE